MVHAFPSSTGTATWLQALPVQESVVQAFPSLQLQVHAPQVRSVRQTWEPDGHPVSLQVRVLPVVQTPCVSSST